ncbi:hypothetical protein Tco_0665912 [Tanacetum coccineum]
MKDLGEAAYILGIKIIRDRSKRLIALSQSAYLEKILKKFRMENSKKGYTSMMEKPDYRNSQGSIMYTLLMDLEMSCHRIKGLRRCYVTMRKYHYIREVIQEGEIILKKVHTYDNIADPFTKPMPFCKHFEHAMAIGIVPASSLM